MKRLVFATNNKHKIEEARAILGPAVELVSLGEIGCNEELPETQATLEGNALQKARYVQEHYGVACVADDTGLMVDALGGEPGVLSARYAGTGHDSEANMRKLLHNMADKDDRRAHFSTMLAYVDAEGNARTFEGRVDGEIARERSGESGFGYDPVFIAGETGETFARMSPEAKNAISHRGRAFRKFRDWFVTLILLIMMWAAPAQAVEWKQHPSYDGQTYRIIESPKYTYFIALKDVYDVRVAGFTRPYGQLYSYDKDNDEWKWLNAETGLSENVVCTAGYDFKNRLLVVGYINGNIDLLSDSGEVTNIPGLKQAGANASQDIMDINVDENNGNAWIATGTGYVSINTSKGEVSTSRNYGRPVQSVGKVGEYLLVAADSCLWYGSELSGDLGSFRKVENTDKRVFRRMLTLGDRVYAMYGDRNPVMGRVLIRDGVPEFQVTSYSNEYSMERGADCIITSGRRWVRVYDRNGRATDFPMPEAVADKAPQGASLDGKTWWFSAGRDGYYRMTAPGADGKWTVTMQEYFPNAANAFRCRAMVYDRNLGMMIRNHGHERPYNTITTPDLLCRLKDGQWSPLSLTYSGKDPEDIFYTSNPMGLSIDPVNPNHIYCGSNQYGLLRLDLTGEHSLRIGRPNDHAAGKNGFVAGTQIMQEWSGSCNFGVPKFDSYNTMWVPYLNPDTKQAEIWYWPADDRAASISTATYRPLKKKIFRNVEPDGSASLITLASQRDMIIYASGGYGSSIVVWYHGGTLDTESDDVVRVLSTFVDQDGSTFDCRYVRSMYEDRSTGRVWVMYQGGVFTFNPVEMANGNTTVRRVKVARNDGTNLADLLLDGVDVISVTVDPAGRKWFATNGGGIVVTSADGTKILNTYTTDNSGLPSNSIDAICYNPDNGSMMVSTGEGLVEAFLNEAETSGKAQVRAYPNPVRPGYMGMVTIDMLPESSMVKIMDAAGRMVRELGEASGGSIEWDMTNYNRRRVPAGIYYILGTNGANQDAFTKMGKILVVE